MKKTTLIISLFILVLIIGASAFLYYSLNSILKKGVENYGPKLTRTEVRLKSSNISFFSGKGSLSGLFVGNPDGYSTESAFTLDNIYIDLDVLSVFSKKITINRILIEEPSITYEIKGTNASNLKTIFNNIKSYSGMAKKANAYSRKKDDSPQDKKIIIKDFTLAECSVSVSHNIMGKRLVSADLPVINLKNIGEKRKGTSVSEAVKLIMEKITHTIITTSSTDKVLKDAADAALNKVRDDVNRIIPENHRDALDQFIDKDSDVSLDRLKGFLK